MIRSSLRAVLVFALAATSFAATASRDAVPSVLAPWIPWVLRDLGDSACPSLSSQSVCQATSSLEMRVAGGQATFKMKGWRWSEGWVVLPGDTTLWPETVKLGGSPKAVLRDGERPGVLLKPGPFQLEGVIRWTKRPSAIPLPGDVAFRNLFVDGKSVAAGAGDELWLQREEELAESVRDTTGDIRIKVFRRVDDGIPVLATTRIELSISGKERALDLESVLPEGAIATDLESDLPARLTRNGKLGLTARAGNWSVTIRSAWIVPPKSFRMPKAVSPWPASEIWSFQSAPDVRTVRLTGATPVDAAQAEVPPENRSLPAWSLASDKSMEVGEILRGDPTTDSVKVYLARDVWVDFDGKGATIRDEIAGQIRRPLRLSVLSPLHLGRGEVRGEGQILTTLGGEEQGFPVNGNGQWTLLSRLNDHPGQSIPLSPTGWDLERATVNVHLGLGWKLLEITGAGNSSGTWISGWDLWSIFLVVLLTGILAKIVSKKVAALAAVVFILGSQDGIQIGFWLHLVVAASAWFALKEFLPNRMITRLAGAWTAIAGLIVLGIVLSFTIQQVRLAMHPSLDDRFARPDLAFGMQAKEMAVPQTPSADMNTAGVPEMEAAHQASLQNSVMDKIETKSDGLLGEDVDPNQANMIDAILASGARSKDVRKSAYPSSMSQVKVRSAPPEDDPVLLGGVQAGSGVPNWFHASGSLESEGVVSGAQTFRIVALSPLWVRIWRLLAVMGAWLVLIALARKAIPQLSEKAIGLLRQNPSKVVPLLLLMAVSARAEMPTPQMLDDLRNHLVRAPVCEEACARFGEARISIRGNLASVDLEVQAEARGVVRLPQIDWRPTGLSVPRGAAGADENELWAVVEPGFQTIHMEGVVNVGSLLIGFQDIPFRGKIEAAGWVREGDDPASVHLVRTATSKTSATHDSSVAELAPLATITRAIHLRREWTIETVVERASSAPGALALSIPLLAGEKPVGDISVDSGHARVVLSNGVQRISWNSRLPVSDKIRLTAANNGMWTETWSLESSTRWHVLAGGIPRIRAQQSTWKPLPGEKLELAVLSPKTLEGPLHSIQEALLTTRAGRDITECTLDARVVSGIGGELFATLPVDAKVRRIEIDGLERPPQATREGQQRLEVSPGQHRIRITWNQGSIGRFLVHAPEVSISAAGANFSSSLETAEEGWVIALGGPGEGPGILWWGMVAAMAILSWILSRIPGHPIRFVDWLLLFLGTSTVNRFGALPLVIWIWALLWREHFDPSSRKPWQFNLIQIALAGFGVVALLTLLSLVPVGLLGRPEMLVQGPHGDRNWFADRSTGGMPRPWLLVLPLWLWKALLLAWSLWMVRALLGWVKWAVGIYTRNGIWASEAHALASVKENPDNIDDPQR